jgi:hypothetical protein
VDDPNHVIVINEWSHGFGIQRLLEPNPGTSSASLLINGRSERKVRDSARDIFDTAIMLICYPTVMLSTLSSMFNEYRLVSIFSCLVVRMLDKIII